MNTILNTLVCLRPLLLPLSFIFRLLIFGRRCVYRLGWVKSVHLGPRTISIGNIEAGGTGKSPFVSGLASALIAGGHRPIVLARGYGSGLSRDCAALFVGSRLLEVREFGSGSGPRREHQVGVDPTADEARMISAENPTMPVIIGRNRVTAYREFSDFLATYSPTHVILDDGFQHWRIQRDVDVVLVSEDFSGDFNSRFLLPAGNLREPVAALLRAGKVVQVTGRGGALAGVAPPKALVVEGLPVGIAQEHAHIIYGALEPAGGSLLGARRLPLRPIAACGIAHPEYFLLALAGAGVSPIRTVTVRDHGRFDAQHFSPEAIRGADGIVTTSKDYWRDPEIMSASGLSVWILPMKISFPYQIIF